MDNSVVLISIFSNSQEVSVISQSLSSGKRWYHSSIRKIQTSIRPHFEKQRNPSQHVKMGEEADDILNSFRLSNNRKKYNTVSNKSEAYFVK